MTIYQMNSYWVHCTEM